MGRTSTIHDSAFIFNRNTAALPFSALNVKETIPFHAWESATIKSLHS